MMPNINLETYRRTWFLISSTTILLLCASFIGLTIASEEYGFLPLVLLLGLCGVFLILNKPFVGFALMFFFVVLGPFASFTEGGHTINLALAALMLGIFGTKILVLHEKIKLDIVSKFALAFLICGFVTCLWAYNSKEAFSSTLRIGQYVILYILILNLCHSQRHFDALTYSFAVGSVVAATAAILIGTTYHSSEGSRLTLHERFNPNMFGAMLSTGMILVLYHLYKTKYKLLKVFLILSIIPIEYAIIQTQSRGVWIALPASLLISIVLTTKNLKLIMKAVIAVSLLIGVFISAYYIGIINEEIVARYETLFSEDSDTATAGRVTIWKVGFEMVKDNLLFGVGVNNYYYNFQDYAPEANIYTGIRTSAHNTFLTVLAETGLIGFTLFMGMFVYIFKNIWHLRDPITRLMQMWLFSSLILISIKGTYHFLPWFWFVLVLIALDTNFEKQMDRRLILSSRTKYGE